MSPTTRLLLLTIAAGLTGCATAGFPDTSRLPVAEYAGHLTRTEQGIWFEPCQPVAGTDRLWVTFTGSSVQQVDAARAGGRLSTGERVFVRWSASLTDERHVGPGGPALLVRDIVELRPSAESDCGQT